MAYLGGMSPTLENLPFSQPTSKSVSARIRWHRKSRGLTLHDIERLSAGQIKAVVMGSYERGSRAISLARTIEIANLFAIPVTELISDISETSTTQYADLVFDLRRISLLSRENIGSVILPLDRYLKAVSMRRRDWNGEVLSLRKNDLDALTLLIGKNSDELLKIWIDQKVLFRGPSHP